MTDDLRYLIRGIDYENLPEIDQVEFVDTWMNIQREWAEVTGNNKVDLSLLRMKILAELRNTYNYQTKLYECVKSLPVPELIEIFNSCGFKVDIDNYEPTMQHAYGRLMKMKAQIELEEGNEDNDKEPVDFDELIVLLEAKQGYGFDEHKMSVRKFAKIYKKVTQDGRRQDNKE